MQGNREKIIIFDYDDYISSPLPGEKIIIRFTDEENLVEKCHSIFNRNGLFAIWLCFENKSLSEINVQNSWPTIPIILYCNGLGSTNTVLDMMPVIRKLSLKCYMPASDNNYVGIKILSSLGVDTGLLLNSGENSINAERFLDLVSYACVSPMRHAQIEPFDYIWRNLGQDSNLDFSTVYFENPCKYIHSDANCNAAYNHEHLLNGDYCGHLEAILKDSTQYEEEYKSKYYYSHFMALDKCSKCSAFKICNRKISDLFEDCESVMKEVYDLCELRNSMERKANEGGEICQL